MPGPTLEASEVSSDLADGLRKMLLSIGEDPSREGLLKTPERFSETLRELTSGYHASPLGESPFFEVEETESEDLVTVKGLEFFSLCEHHMLPFFGVCHIGYVPRGKIIGFGRLGQVVETFSKRLQVQERLCHEIGSYLMETLQPAGLGVVMEASHLCMMIRGTRKFRSQVLTSSMFGDFKKPSLRQEFLTCLGHT